MPASNDKRTHMVEQSLVSASSCSSSASTSSASICGGGGDANTSSSGLSLDKSTLSDIKEAEKLQDLEEGEDATNLNNSLKIEDFKKYDDSYISDNLSRDVEEKLDVSNKAKIIGNTVKNTDLNIIQNTST